MVLASLFPDVRNLKDFVPHPSLRQFANKNQCGVTLLHAHHGHFRLLFTEDYTRSRPVSSSDLNVSMKACSWILDEANEWTPYEWTTDELPQQLELSNALALELNALSQATGRSMGVTARPIRRVTELECSDLPGAHVYIPRKESKLSSNSIVTCIGPDGPRDGAQDCDCEYYASCSTDGDGGHEDNGMQVGSGEGAY
jgi:hypothetical protein